MNHSIICDNSNIAISCNNLTKTFKAASHEVTALRDVTFRVNKGEFLMLVGPSGCGKTTLISILAGILKPTSGECHVLNHHYPDLSDEELITFRSKHVGFIFQSFNLIPTISLAENISIPLLIQGHTTEYAIEQATMMLDKVGLIKRVNSKVTQLSGGEQQRVAIARALVHKPDILICDEPTSALDHSTGSSIMELMKLVNKEVGTTCVIVTHDPRIYHYADRITHMDDGRIINPDAAAYEMIED